MASKQFFITGIPRSRTAWLANFMSTGDVICLHEASLLEYTRVVDSGNYSHVGLAHTELYKYLDVVKDSPVVVVDRNPVEIYDWSDTYCSRSWIDYLYMKTYIPNSLRIEFHEIDMNLWRVWDHLTGLPYDENRAQMLMNYNVQVTKQRLEGLI